MIELVFSSFAQKMLESVKPLSPQFPFIINYVPKFKIQVRLKYGIHFDLLLLSLEKKENIDRVIPSHILLLLHTLVGNIIKQRSWRENISKNISLGPHGRKVRWQNWWCVTPNCSDREDNYSKVPGVIWRWIGIFQDRIKRHLQKI